MPTVTVPRPKGHGTASRPPVKRSWRRADNKTMPTQRYRLVTRSDFDGLVCAVLLKKLGLIEEITFVHPKDVQDGTVAIGPGDITTNLPSTPHAHLVYDHHGGRDRFPGVSEELMRAVDQADSARYSLDEVLHPQGWTLLNFLMDSRTGLGRFREFRISNHQRGLRITAMSDLITSGIPWSW